MGHINKRYIEVNMRHLKRGRKFNRNSSHRLSMLNNLAVSILTHQTINTTIQKAKDIRRIIDKLISWGKADTLHARRLAYKILKNHNLVKKLFNNISIKYKSRQGGYTSIIRNGYRKGDNAPMSIIKLI